MNNAKSRLGIMLSMVIFGTIGIFRRYIPLSSSVLAMMRGFIGCAFLLAYVHIRGIGLDKDGIRKHFFVLALSGAAIGVNWILLFEAYRYTTVAVATLCYYMAPVLVILASALMGERLSLKKLICVAIAIGGMVLVSGVLDAEAGAQQGKGIAFGLGAALLYASVILLNKRLSGVQTYDRTIIQLGAAAVTLVPYTIATGAGFTAESGSMALVIGMLALVGVVHTGVAYALYFGSMKALSAQTVALMSYIDPVVAIILSWLVLGETMGGAQAAGALLVLGATLVSELPEKK